MSVETRRVCPLNKDNDYSAPRSLSTNSSNTIGLDTNVHGWSTAEHYAEMPANPPNARYKAGALGSRIGSCCRGSFEKLSG